MESFTFIEKLRKPLNDLFLGKISNAKLSYKFQRMNFLTHFKLPTADDFGRFSFIPPGCNLIGNDVLSVCHLCEC